MSEERREQLVPWAKIPPRATAPPPPPPPSGGLRPRVSAEREEYVRNLLAQHREALHEVLETEKTYRLVVAGYRDRNPDNTALADVLAGNDPRAQKAAADGAWQRDRADMFALSYLAETTADDRKARR